MSRFNLREFRESDLPALLDVWTASWSATYPDIDFDARREWFTGHLAALRAEGALVHVAENGGSFAGFITLDPRTQDIDQLAVAVEHFGAGLAARLLDSARELSPQRLRLGVNKANARALRFYEREGFTRTGEGVNATSGREFWRMEWRGEEGPRPHER